MLTPTSRAVLRRSHRHLYRHSARLNSTTSQAANAASAGASKAADAASSATSKAAEGLSRVTSSAGPALGGMARGAGNTLRRVGGRTARLVSFVESMVPPTIYYSKVGWEVARLVFQGQRMTPPSVPTVQAYLQPLVESMRRPWEIFSLKALFNLTSYLGRMRNLNRRQMAAGAVISAELLGFFTVGEMIGRFKLVGYRGETASHR